MSQLHLLSSLSFSSVLQVEVKSGWMEDPDPVMELLSLSSISARQQESIADEKNMLVQKPPLSIMKS